MIILNNARITIIYRRYEWITERRGWIKFNNEEIRDFNYTRYVQHYYGDKSRQIILAGNEERMGVNRIV